MRFGSEWHKLLAGAARRPSMLRSTFSSRVIQYFRWSFSCHVFFVFWARPPFSSVENSRWLHWPLQFRHPVSRVQQVLRGCDLKLVFHDLWRFQQSLALSFNVGHERQQRRSRAVFRLGQGSIGGLFVRFPLPWSSLLVEIAKRPLLYVFDESLLMD